METGWRDQLRQKIREVQSRGGPPTEGEKFGIPVRLNSRRIKEFESFLLGRTNSRPFGDAPALTLQLRSMCHWTSMDGHLLFFFFPSPLDRSAPSVDFNIRFFFPIDRGQLAEMRVGRRRDAVVPIPSDEAVSPGGLVAFAEATFDPFGNPVFVPGADPFPVTLTTARDENYPWADQKLFYVAWDRGRTADR